MPIYKENWAGSCLISESTLHQIAPYIGKMKSAMARTLVEEYSHPGDTVLDPYVGSGTVALECLISGRAIIAADINPYAVLLTKSKLSPPPTLAEALQRASYYIEESRHRFRVGTTSEVPDWVKEFFHPQTLAETIRLNGLMASNREYFLQACLLGILHHQRPGFLSYPASHLVPYLRTRKYPREKFPEMYAYRAVAPRLMAKINRVYRRFPEFTGQAKKMCLQQDASKLRLPPNTVDAIITSPPYMNALDYARDNRLRLWFLGVEDVQSYDTRANTREKFAKLMEDCLRNVRTALKSNGPCVLVVGELSRSCSVTNIADIVVDLAINKVGGFAKEGLMVDAIPDIRRSRRDGKRTKREWIVILRKRGEV